MRRQGFEFNDLEWYPQTWRQILTACTGFFAVVFDVFRPILPQLADALRASDARVILDLCSGGAGQLVRLQRLLAEHHQYPVRVVLSDKYPDLDVFRNAARSSDGDVRFIEEPVDAASAPSADGAFRTIFTAFHHFEPDAACRILQDAATNRVGIGAFEYTDRSVVWYVSALLSPLFCWLTAPWAIRPFTLKVFFWVYLLPIPVLLIPWDGIVSGLRTYDPDALRLLVSRVDAPDYAWDIGKVRTGVGHHLTYLIGHPRP
ncbi:MAG TPA: class I SAM-dependent methyltransferase [Vicinamibacterales bacterium]|jgi:hypothetical protein